MIKNFTDVVIFGMYSLFMIMLSIDFIKRAKPNREESGVQYFLYYFGGYGMLPLLFLLPFLLLLLKPLWGVLIFSLVVFIFFAVTIWRTAEVGKRDLKKFEEMGDLTDKDIKQYNYVKMQYRLYRILRWVIIIGGILYWSPILSSLPK